MADFFEMPDADEEVNNTVPQEQPPAIPASSYEYEDEDVEPEGLPEPEPEDALAAFNREWNQKLETKRQLEERAEEEAKAAASEDLSQWKNQRDVRLNAKKEVNRTEEQVLLEQQESDLDAGNVWDRVTKLIEASVDQPDDASKADVSRMRKLFIQLKNEPLESTRGALVEA